MTRRAPRSGVAAAALLAFAPVAVAPILSPARAQDELTQARPGAEAGSPVTADEWMIAAANPLAVQAGADVLAEGGSAIDAMIATQLVLNLVEPQSSGIGGGAFLVYWDAGNERLTSYDGRETAPMAATEELFIGEDGEPMGFWDAVVGGRSVGTPGLVRLMAEAHADHGTLPWARLFQPAIDLADSGFEVSPRLAGMLDDETRAERLRTFEATADYFFPEGRALEAGDRRDNPAFAESLRTLAEQGPSAFYEGPIAELIVDAVRNAPTNPGLLSLEDLASYQAPEREPVCLDYRAYEVCGMGPPTSGGLTVTMILGLLEHFDLPSMGPDDPHAWHLFAEAAKLAYADRGQYMADADFVNVPAAGLLDEAYLTYRAQLIDPARAMETPAPAGNPPWDEATLYAPDTQLDRPGTSHISIVDAEGNAVSLTTSIETAFGSQLMAGGFLLNNQLTDFSFRPEVDGRPVANRVQPGKRPRSSMAPMIAFGEDGSLELVVGSPGGSRIIMYSAQALVAMLDWGMDPQAAVELPHIVNRNGATDLEAGTWAEDLAEPLQALGHEVNVTGLNSGLHAVRVVDGGLEGGADPRREGIAMGR